MSWNLLGSLWDLVRQCNILTVYDNKLKSLNYFRL